MDIEQAEALLSTKDGLAKFMPAAQVLALRALLHGEEGEHFAKTIRSLHERISSMPVTYEQDGLGGEAIAHLHYFAGSADFWITEKDVEGGVQQAFGLACLTGNPDDGELGYISIEEITSHGVELDLHWTPKSIDQIRNRGIAPPSRQTSFAQDFDEGGSPSP